MTQPTLNYAELYRELISELYGVRWETADAELPLDILGRMWQPRLARDIELINHWVTLMTFCMYAHPELFDERLHEVGLAVRDILGGADVYTLLTPTYVRVRSPRVQASRHFFLLTRGWASEMRVISKAEEEAAALADATQQLFLARQRLGSELMNYSTAALITETILGVAEGLEPDEDAGLWLTQPKGLAYLQQHVRALSQLHELLQGLPVYKQLATAHLGTFYDRARDDSSQAPFYTADALPEAKDQ